MIENQTHSYISFNNVTRSFINKYYLECDVDSRPIIVDGYKCRIAYT